MRECAGAHGARSATAIPVRPPLRECAGGLRPPGGGRSRHEPGCTSITFNGADRCAVRLPLRSVTMTVIV
jgi:hypothetical protein